MLLAKKPGSPFPLYYKVMMEIRDNILSGKWGSGSQIPGELGSRPAPGGQRHYRSTGPRTAGTRRLSETRKSKGHLRKLEGPIETVRELGSAGG